jgi:nicotinamidase-related amidase
MWNAHHCRSAEQRVREMAPHLDHVVEDLRHLGALIVHAPAGCMEFYERTPARLNATQAKLVASPVRIDWNDRNPDREPELPRSLARPGGCSCDSVVPCGTGDPPYPWTRQIEMIRVADRDAVTDDGAELFALLEMRGIEDVIVMGVHTNVCVLGRPYGIRQLVYSGKRPLLCRDLTDSFHRDARGHQWGTEQTIHHIESHWCPSVSSDQLVGGKPFQFAVDETPVRTAP